MALRKLLAYGCIYILWGGSFLAIREMVGSAHAPVPPFFAAGFRFSVAGLALLSPVWVVTLEAAENVVILPVACISRCAVRRPWQRSTSA